MSDQRTLSEWIALWAGHETWRRVAVAPAYEISSLGTVRRVGASRPLTPGYQHGYAHVSLCHEGQIRTTRVHKLVAYAFLGAAPFEGAVVAHNDGNKANNRVDNVRWATPRENSADQIRHFTRQRGSEVFGAKLTEDEIPSVRERIGLGEPLKRIAADYDVSISTISLIKRQRIWRHV
jgi:hypothetical protein